jgi:hypothetical protein
MGLLIDEARRHNLLYICLDIVQIATFSEYQLDRQGVPLLAAYHLEVVTDDFLELMLYPLQE